MVCDVEIYAMNAATSDFSSHQFIARGNDCEQYENGAEMADFEVLVFPYESVANYHMLYLLWNSSYLNLHYIALGLPLIVAGVFECQVRM